MSTSSQVCRVEVVGWSERGEAARDEALAVEEPLELRVAGRGVAVVMRTPGHDRELAAGFFWTEGLLRGRDELLDLVPCGRDGQAPTANVLEALLAPTASVDLERLTRHVFTSSSCGICSKASIEAVRQTWPALPPRVVSRGWSRAVITGLPAGLAEAQRGFAETGGLHASGLFTAAGERRVVREDVGRHNALDKVIGWAFLHDHLPLHDDILMVSGRLSFELMQKALAAGVGCVAAISAPSSAAVAFARSSGQTLVAFVRPGRMTVYAGQVV